MRQLIFGFLMVLLCTGFATRQARAETFYISPSGDDSKTGKSENDA